MDFVSGRVEEEILLRNEYPPHPLPVRTVTISIYILTKTDQDNSILST